MVHHVSLCDHWVALVLQQTLELLPQHQWAQVGNRHRLWVVKPPLHTQWVLSVTKRELLRFTASLCSRATTPSHQKEPAEVVWIWPGNSSVWDATQPQISRRKWMDGSTDDKWLIYICRRCEWLTLLWLNINEDRFEVIQHKGICSNRFLFWFALFSELDVLKPLSLLSLCILFPE